MSSAGAQGVGLQMTTISTACTTFYCFFNAIVQYPIVNASASAFAHNIFQMWCSGASGSLSTEKGAVSKHVKTIEFLNIPFAHTVFCDVLSYVRAYGFSLFFVFAHSSRIIRFAFCKKCPSNSRSRQYIHMYIFVTHTRIYIYIYIYIYICIYVHVYIYMYIILHVL